MRLRLPVALVWGASLAVACQNFPAGFVPFASIAYLSGANSAGDRLVVGTLADPTTQSIAKNVPLPGAANETYCDSQVQLGPKNSYLNVYVPTSAERSGNFSAFAGLLIDPLTNGQPFPGGIIPASRLGGTYAWRVGSQDAGPPSITTTSLPAATPGVLYLALMAASGGALPYTWSATGLPQGISLNTNGAFTGSTGATASGIYLVNITVKDGVGATASKQLSLLVSSLSTTVSATPLQLKFSAIQGGNSPGPQTISVTAPGTAPVGFSVQIDGGISGTAPPSWLSVQPLSGSTPAALTVTAIPGTLPTGTLTGRIRVVPRDQTQSPIDISVTFTIKTAPPQLTVAPPFLQFTIRFGSSEVQEQTLLARNSGGGTVSFSTSVLGKSTWIKSVTPTSGQTVPDTPVILKVDVSGQGLTVGVYTDTIRFTWAGNTTDIPVALTVRNPGAVLKLSSTSARFEARQGNGVSEIQNISVINTGDAGTTVNFGAKLLSGSDWLSVSLQKGQATTASPGILLLQPNAIAIAAFPAGVRTALVQVTDPSAQNPLQLLTVVLQVDAAAVAAPPDPSPAGLFLVTTAGAGPVTQPVALNYSSTAVAVYQTGTTTTDGTGWLSVSPAIGQVSTANPAQLTFTGNASTLKAGIYSGTANIVIGTVLRSVQVTLIVKSAGAVANPFARDAAACVPQQLVLVQTELAGNFTLLVGFPALLSMQVNDDCGNAVLDASVVASFDNGDAPLRLDSDNATGFYATSWSPGHVFPNMNITFDATSPTLLSPSTPTGQSSKVDGAVNTSAAGAKLSGNVAANPNPLPVLALGGTVNNSNIVLNAPISPGLIASTYGSGLASGISVPPTIPLATALQGTTILVGNLPTPLYYVSPTQVNIQIPYELAPNQSYPVVAQLNGLSSVPDKVTLVAATPTVLAFGDGSSKAQHSDSSFVTSTSPAKPGEGLAIYLVGMGVTTPSLASGAGAPGNPLAKVTAQVMVDGQNAPVSFAGLTPGSVGLYQINFNVPTTARTGTLNLVVTQNGFASNVTKLFVAQ